MERLDKTIEPLLSSGASIKDRYFSLDTMTHSSFHHHHKRQLAATRAATCFVEEKRRSKNLIDDFDEQQQQQDTFKPLNDLLIDLQIEDPENLLLLNKREQQQRTRRRLKSYNRNSSVTRKTTAMLADQQQNYAQTTTVASSSAQSQVTNSVEEPSQSEFINNNRPLVEPHYSEDTFSSTYQVSYQPSTFTTTTDSYVTYSGQPSAPAAYTVMGPFEAYSPFAPINHDHNNHHNHHHHHQTNQRLLLMEPDYQTSCYPATLVPLDNSRCEPMGDLFELEQRRPEDHHVDNRVDHHEEHQQQQQLYGGEIGTRQHRDFEQQTNASYQTSGYSRTELPEPVVLANNYSCLPTSEDLSQSYTQLANLSSLQDPNGNGSNPLISSITSTSISYIDSSDASGSMLSSVGQINNNTTNQQQARQQVVVRSKQETDIRVCEWEGCDNTFIDMQEFVRHLEEKHVNQEPKEKNRYFCLWLNCKRNEQEFNARYKLLIHMRVHSGEKPYPCENENCNKSFSRLENFKIHRRSHTGEKPYKCNFENCTKSFTNSSDRIKHHKTHKDPKPYSCTYNGCTKKYTDPSSLRKHLRAHKRNQQLPPLATCPPDFDPAVMLPADCTDSTLSSSDAGHSGNWACPEAPNPVEQRRQLQWQRSQHSHLSRSWCAGSTSQWPSGARMQPSWPNSSASSGNSSQQQPTQTHLSWNQQQHQSNQHSALMRSMPPAAPTFRRPAEAWNSSTSLVQQQPDWATPTGEWSEGPPSWSG